MSFTLFPSTVFAGGNDLIQGELRVDLNEVNSAHDYIASIDAGGLPTNTGNNEFTTGWLGIDLPAFMQVGFMTDKDGVHWFVEEYTTGTLQCFHGTKHTSTNPPYEACYGDYGDRATLNQFQTVELVTYPNQGFWIARVQDQYGNPLDVAEIDYVTPTNNLTRADLVAEKRYAAASDPHFLAIFYFSHPRYYIGGTGDPFAEWPASDGTHNNYLAPSPSGICPKYYNARLNFAGDSRIWYAGTKSQGQGVCSGHMF